jgi:hypothetical protein
MKLTSIMFNHALNSLGESWRAQDERRRAPRVGLRGTVDAWMKTGEQVSRITITLRDLSVSGVGFIYRDRLKAGTALAIEFPNGDDGVMKVACRIMRCEMVSGGFCLFGAAFQTPLLRRDLPGGQAAPQPTVPEKAPATSAESTEPEIAGSFQSVESETPQNEEEEVARIRRAMLES